jgi:indolepyruvate ferredoxin oxidoreductase alpha subunit
MKSQIWLMDPRPNLPSIVQAVEKGFELSEASNTPVMLMLRIRACHVYGHFKTKDNVRPSFGLTDALEKPSRDLSRIAMPPMTYVHEKDKWEKRWPDAVKFVEDNRLNEFFDGEANDIGIVLQGGIYNTTLRALLLNGLADAFGVSKVPLYVMNVTYPLVDKELIRFCTGKKAILVVEEGGPDYIEQAVNTILRRADIQTKVHGKDVLPMAGEYTGAVVREGIRKFIEKTRPDLLPLPPSPRLRGEGRGEGEFPDAQIRGDAPSPDALRASTSPRTAGRGDAAAKAIAAANNEVQPRPPSFCTGCPERPIFAAMKLVERDLGPHHVSADIGCHLFSIFPPFNIGATTMGYGLGAAGASALNVKAGKRAISMMGDGGFWHNGLTSGVGNAVFNKSDNVLIIVDNGYSAATGGQDIPSSFHPNANRGTMHSIEQAVRGVGVTWAKTIDRTYDVALMRDTLKEALTTKEKGPKVIVAHSECMLNKQRRIRPLMRKAAQAGERVVRERFGVDPDTCTGDHSCIRLSGCPSLTIAPNPDPLRREPVTKVINSCVGCGLCGEVSHAAVLCPSFYRASLITNPTGWDKFKARIRDAVIGFFQRRIERRLAVA